MKTGMLSLIASVSLFILVTGCTKDPLKHMTEDESRIYITNHDSTVNFTNFRTFSVADSVALVYNNKSGGKDQSSYDLALIAALKAAMIKQGYTLVDRESNPDLALGVTVISNDQTSLVNYGDYGGYYGDYWDPYYWGYPGYSYGYPSYYGVYTVNETALAVDMFDLKDAATSNEIKNVWSALIRGEGIFNSGKADAQVQTLFDQSAYVKAN
jgi:hypothetical protein